MAQKIMPILADPLTYMGKEVTLQGRVRTMRDSKSVVFVNLWDGSRLSDIQVVASDTLARDMAEALGTGDIVEITGRVTESPAKGQTVELQAVSFTKLADCPPDYPLQKKRHSFEFLRTIPHLRPRTNTFYSVFKIRSLLSYAIHEFFRKEGFLYVHTPVITTNDAEGAGELFQVTTLPLARIPMEDGRVDYGKDFFSKPTHLTVSGQLNVEGFALTYGDCYTFGPTFRAENSNTTRHAAEFWMVEPEMAFCDLWGDMDNAQRMLKYCIDYLFIHGEEELAFFDQFVEKGLIQRLEKVRDADFIRITYTEAIDRLLAAHVAFEHPVSWGMDLQTEQERYLCENIFNRPVFVTDYPKEIKAFYMRQNDDERTVAAMDLLVPGVGELIGGSQREERFDVLLKRMQELGMEVELYRWYLDLRKYGTIVHSGYGLGLERAVMYLTGMSNIRDVLPYPRTPNNAEY